MGTKIETGASKIKGKGAMKFNQVGADDWGGGIRGGDSRLVLKQPHLERGTRLFGSGEKGRSQWKRKTTSYASGRHNGGAGVSQAVTLGDPDNQKDVKVTK